LLEHEDLDEVRRLARWARPNYTQPDTG